MRAGTTANGAAAAMDARKSLLCERALFDSGTCVRCCEGFVGSMTYPASFSGSILDGPLYQEHVRACRKYRGGVWLVRAGTTSNGAASAKYARKPFLCERGWFDPGPCCRKGIVGFSSYPTFLFGCTLSNAGGSV